MQEFRHSDCHGTHLPWWCFYPGNVKYEAGGSRLQMYFAGAGFSSSTAFLQSVKWISASGWTYQSFQTRQLSALSQVKMTWLDGTCTQICNMRLSESIALPIWLQKNTKHPQPVFLDITTGQRLWYILRWSQIIMDLASEFGTPPLTFCLDFLFHCLLAFLRNPSLFSNKTKTIGFWFQPLLQKLNFGTLEENFQNSKELIEITTAA